MRVLITGDMEGVCGIQSWEHTFGSSPLYAEGRVLYTEEINAAVRGCLRAGAVEVVAHDGHGGSVPDGKPFMNWVPERFEPGARYVQGYPWSRYVEPFDAGFDALVLVGVHAMAGTPDGVLSHTVSADGWYAVRVNGHEIGETGILAAIAGDHGVPAVAASGDTAVCRELRALVGPALATAEVKRGLGRYAAVNMAPVEARALIEETFARALADRASWPAPLRLGGPVTLEVQLASPDRARAYAGRDHVRIVDGRTLQADGATFTEAWDRLYPRA